MAALSPISQNLLDLQGEITKIKSGLSLQETQALKYAEELAVTVHLMREDILLGINEELNNEEEEKESNIYKNLKKNPIPFSTAMALTEILTASSIQFEDDLKRVLSKSMCIYWEIIGFQVSAKGGTKGRRIYENDVKDLTDKITKVIKTLPRSEFETRFALKCCEATARRLQPGEGKVKEIVRDFAPDILIGVLQSIFNRSPAQAVPPLVNLSMRIYREIEFKWYRDTWSLNWGKRPTNVDEFNELVKGIDKHKEKNKSYFCLVSVIEQTFKTDSQDLRAHVFKDSPSSLLSLAEKTPDRNLLAVWKKDKYWKTRCYALQVIQRFVQQESAYETGNLGPLFARRMFEENQCVCQVAGEVFLEISKVNKGAVQIKANDLPPESEGLKEKINEANKQEKRFQEERAENSRQQEKAPEKIESRHAQSFKHDQPLPKTKYQLKEEGRVLVGQLAESQLQQELYKVQLRNKELLN